MKYYGIMGKRRNTKQFRPFEYKSGKFAINRIYQTLWTDKDYVQSLVDYLNKHNQEFTFKIG